MAGRVGVDDSAPLITVLETPDIPRIRADARTAGLLGPSFFVIVTGLGDEIALRVRRCNCFGGGGESGSDKGLDVLGEGSGSLDRGLGEFNCTDARALCPLRP